jgi:hypothetical protein
MTRLERSRAGSCGARPVMIRNLNDARQSSAPAAPGRPGGARREARRQAAAAGELAA